MTREIYLASQLGRFPYPPFTREEYIQTQKIRIAFEQLPCPSKDFVDSLPCYLCNFSIHNFQ